MYSWLIRPGNMPRSYNAWITEASKISPHSLLINRAYWRDGRPDPADMKILINQKVHSASHLYYHGKQVLIYFDRSDHHAHQPYAPSRSPRNDHEGADRTSVQQLCRNTSLVGIMHICSDRPIYRSVQMDVPDLRCSTFRTGITIQEERVGKECTRNVLEAFVGYCEELDLFGRFCYHLSKWVSFHGLLT